MEDIEIILDETLVVKEINRLKRMSFRHFIDMMDDAAHDRFRTGVYNTIEDLRVRFTDEPEVFESLLYWAEDNAAEEAREKANNRLHQFQARSMNRAQYLGRPILVWYSNQYTDGRFALREEVRCAGLLEAVLEHQNQMNEPPSVYTITEENEDGEQVKVPSKVWARYRSQGYAISKGRLLWNMRSNGWGILTKLFPKDIDMNAYAHSLAAPLIPNGFLPEASVTFRKLKHRGRDLGTDGSGIYHPRAPQVAALIDQFGPLPFQFRYIHTGGIFAKGMLFPSEDAVDDNGQPTIVVDWNQIKGKTKAMAKTRREEDAVKTVEGGFFGILRYWRRSTPISSSFEILENIKNTPRTRELITMALERQMRQLSRRGEMGIVQRVARQDETIKWMAHLTQAINETLPDDKQVSLFQVPRIRQAAKNALENQLYELHQGGGLQFKSYVVRMDSLIPKGTCVVSNLPPNREIAVIRFPTVLAQGLVKLKTTKPRKRHLVDGQVSPATIIMHPHDLVTSMQGDDDGDIVGISTDPLVLELFDNRIDDNRYHVEPEGERRDVSIRSPEGLDFIMGSAQGPVGLCTIWRSALLSVGDIAAANAMSIGIQESVDAAKNFINYSDVPAASSLANWERDSEGEYHFRMRLRDSQGEYLHEFPADEISNWVSNRIMAAGCVKITTDDQGREKAEPGNPLAWRSKSRKVDLDNWVECRIKAGWNGGNLSHWSHDETLRLWRDIATQFKFDSKPINPAQLLIQALASRGVQVELNPVEMENYFERNGLFARSGLETYAKEVSFSLRNIKNSDALHQRINTAQSKMEASLSRLNINELATIWIVECSRDNLNNAYRAVCWNGSPILNALDLDEWKPDCDFLSRDQAYKIADMVLKKDQPHHVLTELLARGHKHQQNVFNNDGQGIPVHQCSVCCSKMQDALIDRIRARHSSALRDWGTMLRDIGND